MLTLKQIQKMLLDRRLSHISKKTGVSTKIIRGVRNGASRKNVRYSEIKKISNYLESGLILPTPPKIEQTPELTRCDVCSILKFKYEYQPPNKLAGPYHICTDCFSKYLSCRNGAPTTRLSTWIRIHNKPVRTITNRQWLKILKMQNNRCNGCGIEFASNFKPVKDHILPYSKGWDLTYGNTQALCKSYNSRKSNKIDISNAINNLIWKV
jgi:hypothetical protein